PTSALDSVDKSVTARCPSGKKVIGAGGELVGGGGHVVMPRITPNATLDSVTVASVEDADPTASTWRVRAHAICAFPITGLTRVEAHSDLLHPSNPNSATATCPTGTHVIGTGGEIDHDFLDDVGNALLEGGHMLNDVTPNSSLTSVTVTGYDGQHAW